MTDARQADATFKLRSSTWTMEKLNTVPCHELGRYGLYHHPPRLCCFAKLSSKEVFTSARATR